RWCGWRLGYQDDAEGRRRKTPRRRTRIRGEAEPVSAIAYGLRDSCRRTDGISNWLAREKSVPVLNPFRWSEANRRVGARLKSANPFRLGGKPVSAVFLFREPDAKRSRVIPTHLIRRTR